MIDELGDVEMHFEKFMRHVNDYYNQRNTSEGIERIFKLFDNEQTGVLTRDDIYRIS